jgi:hypothetical protein
VSRRLKVVHDRPADDALEVRGERRGVLGACPRCRTLVRRLNQPDDCECGWLRRQSGTDGLREADLRSGNGNTGVPTGSGGARAQNGRTGGKKGKR